MKQTLLLHDMSLSEKRGFIRMHRHVTPYGDYSMGDFVHPHGIVAIYQQDDITRLDYAYNGRLYIRSWPKEWGRRTICKLARQFVDDVRSGKTRCQR